LDTHLSHAERVATSSNAAAAKMVVGKPGEAAIAGESAANKYQLHALVKGIEDIKNNTTRFYVIGDRDVPPSGKDSTSLLVGAPHKPGGLRRLLLPLEEAGVSMTRIESRPGRTRLWDYVFFIDVDGHAQDEVLTKVLATMADEAPLLRVLGSYPSAL
jgi:chorismate mutase/prephenate dehydratase